MKKIYLHGAKEQIARHSTIRDINKQIVLSYVRVRAPISRAEIARETSLQRSTVSAIVDDLEAEGMIEEIGTGDSTGGRKPTLLQLKSGTPAVIGVDIAPRETTIVVADLTGRILEKDLFPTSSDMDFMNRQILTKVGHFTAKNKSADLEVGMSVPGIADQATGKIVYVPYFQWSNWNLPAQIAEKTGLTVSVDNDANAVALAELWSGAEEIRRTRNFITVIVGEGIGTGIIIDGQVYRGEFGAAGEFGHMFIGENASVDCSCGRRDCWEAHASEKAIIQRYAERNGSPASPASVEHLIALAESGEEKAVATVKETAVFLGLGISNLIIGLSPQVVVVSGRIVRVWDLIKDDILKLAERSIRHELSTATAVVPSTLGDRPTVLGSINLVLARKFASAN
jgi:predicted NBD/HSP70 family sugar kinase